MKPLGVIFGTMHSFENWELLLKELPSVSPPEPKTMFIDIPGGDGCLDLTESLTGIVQYEVRDITCTFLSREPKCGWPERYSDIQNYLHGRQLIFKMDNDPGFYYIGRFSVSSWAHDGNFYTIKITGIADPYKLENTSSLEDWEWDTFNFETGVIREYGDLDVDGTLEVTIPGTRMTVVPIITASTAMTVTFEGQTYDLAEGDNEIPEIEIVEGENVLTFTGTGTVSIDYRGGSL